MYLSFKGSNQPMPLFEQNHLTIGWGQTDANGKDPVYLQNAQVKIISDELCYEIQKSKKKKNFNNGFCLMGDKGETSCVGDSGSPVIWEDPNDNNRAYLFGITSQKNYPPNSLPVLDPDAPTCGPFAEFPSKFIKIIDGERDLLKHWFNIDFDECLRTIPKPPLDKNQGLYTLV